MQKLGWFGGLGVTQGHRKQRHLIERMTSYSTLIETIRILYRFRVIARFSSKVTNFNPPHLHLSPPYGVIPFEFRHDLWRQKSRVTRLSCGVVCVILRLAVLIQYRSVTDTQTDRHTHTHTHTHTQRHTTTAYTTLSIAVAR